MHSDGAYRLIRVANGAYSVYSLAYDETFHPVIGPVAEAEALYVRQLRVRERVVQHQGPFVVWDVGLGAAANALTVLRATQDIPCSVHLLSFDQTLEPLQFALKHTAELGYFGGYEKPTSTLADGSVRHLTFNHGSQEVTWELHLGNFPSLLQSPEALAFPKPHAILFDAFSPATNPAMWTQPLFGRVYQLLDRNRPCTLPTYSRSTMLRVTLLLAGFFVGRGHATGEKEETTIAANSKNLVTDPLDLRWLRRARNSTSAEPLWTPIYRQSPLSAESWEKLLQHPQFTAEF